MRMSRCNHDNVLEVLNQSKISKRSSFVVSKVSFVSDEHVLTATIDKRIKPAAEASCSPRGEYTKVLTADVVKTSPAARKPTI